ncbi:MAG: T9SS type A sorting domain-containing protein [Cytophagales bacterium]|nr:T9SS type A sorting domain-containing protein [Cytophagales bacterium]
MKQLFLIASLLLSLYIKSQAQPGSGYAIEFDGVDDYISTSSIDGIDGISQLTISTWVSVGAYGDWKGILTKENVQSDRINITTGGSGDGDNDDLLLVMSNGVHSGGYSTSDLIVLDEWMFISMVFDGTQTGNSNRLKLYVNGVQEPLTYYGTIPATTPSNSAEFFIGQFPPSGRFNGKMDEFRIWNTARTQTEIRDYMCQKLVGNETNLIHYYRMDEVTGTTLIDETGSTDGTLTNMDDSDWVLSGAPIGDASVHAYTVSTATPILNIVHENGDHMTIDITAKTATSIHLYRVDGQPNITAPPGTQVKLSSTTYYGAKVFGSSGGFDALIYSAIYKYEGHPGILDEDDLELATRNDNSDVTWSQETAILDITENTLELTFLLQGAEFILADVGGSNPLPIELVSFDAEVIHANFVRLNWQTASEVNNDYFTIERSIDGVDWDEILRTDGAGNSTALLSYSAVDDKPSLGVSYYRLKQTDYDGMYSYSDVVDVNLNQTITAIEIYPNPTNHQITIEGDRFELQQIKIFNLLGQDVTKQTVTIENMESKVAIDLSNLISGVYLVKTKTTTNNVYKKK